ncbi:pantothenate kinase 4-like [Dendronephthya gigantea]|uniref:pantothenate kinase 4-like n=1 Tax=Dendronephthya gigantea TaxID=151771 RepID=UPI00106D29AB|nr:pantothenate kinase 4-like [Dendronephthya gigantea]
MNENKESEAESSDYHENNLPINLPQAFRDLKFAKRMAIDIGGSLTKVAYVSAFSRKRPKTQTYATVDDDEMTLGQKCRASSFPLYEVKEEEDSGERLHFVKFETKFLEKCLDFIQQNLSSEPGSTEKNKALKVTGGGAFKYKDEITKKLGVRVDKEDEMQCLIKGCNFMLHNIPNEVFEFHRDQRPQYVFKNLLETDLFPYLLVNIGSGVSILKVDSFDSFVRVGGTSMGGGTFWGLGSLLTSAKGFDDLLDLAHGGQHTNVDMLVKDIYGGDYSLIGLPGDLTACTFGKAVRSAVSETATNVNRTKGFSEKDIAKSLLHMISNDIGQLASLHAKLHGLKRIFFGGFFIRGYPITMHTITFAINYWSKGKQKALFLRHEGYLGAIGAFIKGAEEEAAYNGSPLFWNWGENYAGSSGLPTKTFKTPEHRPDAKCDVLELDRMDRSLLPFPLLYRPSKYHPDTEDLTADETAREYWLDCFESGLHMVVSQAIASQVELSDAKERAEQFRNKYLERLKVLRKKPFAYGNLTVRSLLDTREQILNEFQFSDPYALVKQKENEAALENLTKRLADLDKLSWYDRQIEIIKGILAGNVFDWGANEVVKLMRDGDFHFETARKKLQARPWLNDDVDDWVTRLKGPPHKMAVMFVDNSGVDIVLGVFPFALELLSRGTVVILAANSRPALNDVTYGELQIITEKVAAINPVIRQAVLEKRLIIMESGTFSPCLDLRRVDAELAKTCAKADLVVLEGMGRAIHTNYDAFFTCESLKIAVIKNQWLAKRLNGDMYSVVFRYKCGVGSPERT